LSTPIDAKTVIVSIEFPIENDRIEQTINKPGNSKLGGKKFNPIFTTKVTVAFYIN